VAASTVEADFMGVVAGFTAAALAAERLVAMVPAHSAAVGPTAAGALAEGAIMGEAPIAEVPSRAAGRAAIAVLPVVLPGPDAGRALAAGLPTATGTPLVRRVAFPVRRPRGVFTTPP